MKSGAKVEVCALFLPNSDLKPTDLIEGIGVAKPAADDVATRLALANRRRRWQALRADS